METRPTPDICDEHPEAEVPEPLFSSFGGADHFWGKAVTVRCFEDNSRVREMVGQAGDGCVLVVDGGGSMRCALLGDRLARMAAENGWAGLIIAGCVRDSVELAGIDLGIQALATHPRRSEKRGEGSVGGPVWLAGARVRPGDQVHADPDGIVILPAAD